MILTVKNRVTHNVAVFYKPRRRFTITKFGSLTNHCSNDYNVYLEESNDEFHFKARRKIAKGEELTMTYVDTPDYVQKPSPDFVAC